MAWKNELRVAIGAFRWWSKVAPKTSKKWPMLHTKNDQILAKHKKM